MHKRLALTLAILLIIFLVPKKQTVFADCNGRYSFYIGNASSTCQTITVDCKVAGITKSQINNVFGESVWTTDNGYIESELERLSAKLQFTENLDGRKINYFYSPQIKSYLVINGVKVNIQSVESEDSFAIGTPLIFGSF